MFKSKTSVLLTTIFGVLFITGFWLVSTYVSTVNKEVDLFSMITEKQKSNQQIHDKMWKII